MQEPERFELVSRVTRDQMAGALAFPLFAVLGSVFVAIENAGTMPIAVPVTLAIAVAVGFSAWWWMKRTRPIALTVDGDDLVLVANGRELRGRRADLRGERGYIAPTGRMTGGVRYPAIAFVVGERRVVAMSTESKPTVTQRPLHGTAYTLPPERFTRLAQLLRLT